MRQFHKNIDKSAKIYYYIHNKLLLSADKIWYCGDSIKRDIYGAHNVGIFPVLYEGQTEENVPKFAQQNVGYEIDFNYLHIYDWREMIEILSELCCIFA